MIKNTKPATKSSVENVTIDYFSVKDPTYSLRALLSLLNAKSPTVCANHELSSQFFLYLKLANYSILEALAKRTSVSLNEITNEVLTVGVAYILSHLEEDSKKRIKELAEKIIQDVELKNLLWEDKHLSEIC
ncbi:hypothetical protein [Nitrosomonas sp. Nm33]|uniref:hypothetical protein n=1 Tax=Nitrosomonas sp. Nm33 TaxID=133724 RepID=UPI000897E983|nr:hypothetical protein [Nitrosomonas sp. Nm33]SDY98266.1 hypothetical protein SAMN05421755_107611 [Nitrosomonas sp. Nm33]